MTNNTIHSNNMWSVWKIAKTLFHCAWLLFKKFLNIFRRYSYITSPYGRMNLGHFFLLSKGWNFGIFVFVYRVEDGRLSLLFQYSRRLALLWIHFFIMQTWKFVLLNHKAAVWFILFFTLLLFNVLYCRFYCVCPARIVSLSIIVFICKSFRTLYAKYIFIFIHRKIYVICTE